MSKQLVNPLSRPAGRYRPPVMFGEDAPNWRGGKLFSHGYVRVLMPDHPRANKSGYVAEHILIAEKALGHALPSLAQVHHVNGNPADNRNSNLVICQDQAYHSLLHVRQRALEGCGDPAGKKCCFCKKWDVPSRLIIRSVGNTYRAYHTSCSADASRDRRARFGAKTRPHPNRNRRAVSR